MDAWKTNAVVRAARSEGRAAVMSARENAARGLPANARASLAVARHHYATAARAVLSRITFGWQPCPVMDSHSGDCRVCHYERRA